MGLTVAIIAEGDANNSDCWSGSGRSFVLALRRLGTDVLVVNTALTGAPRAVSGLLSFHPDRRRWHQRFELGRTGFWLRSRQAAAAVRRLGPRLDAVVQIGATFLLPPAARGPAPYIVYCDSNIRHALRGRPYSGASHLLAGEEDDVADREHQVYDAADRIWTMSDILGRSFQADFAQPARKLLTIYAGANQPAPVEVPLRPIPGLPPSVLFIGKDHLRKGSDLLLEAFVAVRHLFPNAELHLVGAVPPGSNVPGVTAHGFLSREREADRRVLADLFRRATVFCMPSRYEPFGIAFVEAMLAGLPCIGTNAWAMPEIIEDGRTGWLVPEGAVGALADTLIRALRDPEESARLGRAGRERALDRFTWDRVAARAVADMNLLLSSKR
jgi:alpha-maltose-1-phosphate synthase